MRVSIITLAERPELTAELVAALRAEWADYYGAENEAVTRATFAARARTDAFPMTLVAIEADAVVGSVSLNIESIDTHRHLTPWIGGLWVTPENRRLGLGASLIEAAETHARRLGTARLHAATLTAGRLFERVGWRHLESSLQHGQVCAVFSKDLKQTDFA